MWSLVSNHVAGVQGVNVEAGNPESNPPVTGRARYVLPHERMKAYYVHVDLVPLVQPSSVTQAKNYLQWVPAEIIINKMLFNDVNLIS